MGFLGDLWDSTGGKVMDGMFGTDPNKAWDKSNFEAKDWSQNQNYDPNSFSYGGQGGAYAEQMAKNQDQLDVEARQRGFNAQNRTLNEDTGMGVNDLMSRQQTQGSVDLARQAAEGNAPSAAQGQLQNGMNRSASQAAGMASGARGGAAMALAQGNAQMGNAAANAQSSNDAAQLRANEMAQARGMYGSLASQQRGQDQNRLQMNNQMQMANRQSNDQYELGMNQVALGRAGNANQIRGQQQQGGIAQQGLLANSNQQAQQMNQQTNLYNTEAVKGRMAGVGGGLGSLGGMAMSLIPGGGALAGGGGK